MSPLSPGCFTQKLTLHSRILEGASLVVASVAVLMSFSPSSGSQEAMRIVVVDVLRHGALYRPSTGTSQLVGISIRTGRRGNFMGIILTLRSRVHCQKGAAAVAQRKEDY